VDYSSTAEAVAAVANLVREWDVSTIVVGHPRSMDGTIGQQARKVEAFVAELEGAVDVPVVLWDERLTTVSAARFLHERGLDARAQKSRIDAAAAAVILQDYLDSQKLREREVGDDT
jgi:putative Holliday junction resolvase